MMAIMLNYIANIKHGTCGRKGDEVECLKAVSATFLLVCCVCLKESTCETRKNVFYFTSKALFVLEIIKFQIFRYSNIMTSSNAQA